MSQTTHHSFRGNMTDNELRSEDSLQPVKYLGRTFCLHPYGLGPTTTAVRLIWTRSKKGRIYNRCALSIHPFGLCIYEEIAPGTYKSVWSHAIEDISYCVAEPYQRRLFAWIARAGSSDELECHVVICKSSDRARITADLLAQMFFDSYRMRQERRRSTLASPAPSMRCSVCQTIARRHRPDTEEDRTMEFQTNFDDYERMSLHLPMISSYYNDTYETKSIRTMAEDESIKPVEYYRG